MLNFKTVTFSFFVLLLGFGIGRWSVSNDAQFTHKNSDTYFESEISDSNQNKNKTVDIPMHASGPESPELTSENKPIFKIKDRNEVNKRMSQIFSSYMDAYERNDIDTQNRLLEEMQLLDAHHEKFYNAKVIALQEDEEWQLAHETLKECVSYLPDSLYCLKRLANIRTSTVDEKLEYATKCIEVKKDEPLCLGDLAIALMLKGDFAKAKIQFERALSFAFGGEGYNRNYLLYQYGLTLENLRLFQEARKVFIESCRLNMKIACERAAE